MWSIGRAALGVASLTGAILAAAWGCRAPGSKAAPDAQSGRVEDRIAAVQLAVARNDRASIPHLVDRLEDEDVAVRMAAILALEKLTGHRFGYRYGSSAEERVSATAVWRRFLHGHRSGVPEDRFDHGADPRAVPRTVSDPAS